jgi:hypothetical protein
MKKVGLVFPSRFESGISQTQIRSITREVNLHSKIQLEYVKSYAT